MTYLELLDDLLELGKKDPNLMTDEVRVVDALGNEVYLDAIVADEELGLLLL